MDAVIEVLKNCRVELRLIRSFGGEVELMGLRIDGKYAEAPFRGGYST